MTNTNVWNMSDRFYLRRRQRPKKQQEPAVLWEKASARKDENAECIAFNGYLKMLERHCDFAYTFSGNGGLRNVVVATILKACGLRAGVWDYYFRAPDRPTHWIEMKHGKNALSDTQKEWKSHLMKYGDTFSIAYSAEEALKQLVAFGIIPPDMVFFGPTAVHIRLQPPSYM